MNWKLLYSDKIDDNLLDSIYSIYEKVYKPKGINKSYDVWKEDFNKQYHGNLKKLTFFITSSDPDEIIGYIIFTEPIIINCEYWSKILEGGVYTNSRMESKTLFIGMFKTLFKYSDERDINFFSEASQAYSTLLRLLFDLQFSFMCDTQKVYKLLNLFLKRDDYDLIYNSGTLFINRNTSLLEKYTGCLINRKAQNLKQRVADNVIEQLEYII